MVKFVLDVSKQSPKYLLFIVRKLSGYAISKLWLNFMKIGSSHTLWKLKCWSGPFEISKQSVFSKTANISDISYVLLWKLLHHSIILIYTYSNLKLLWLSKWQILISIWSIQWLKHTCINKKPCCVGSLNFQSVIGRIYYFKLFVYSWWNGYTADFTPSVHTWVTMTCSVLT